MSIVIPEMEADVTEPLTAQTSPTSQISEDEEDAAVETSSNVIPIAITHSLDHEIPAEKPVDFLSPDILSTAASTARSKKRKTIIPANLKTLRTSVITPGSCSPESTSSIDSPNRLISEERDSHSTVSSSTVSPSTVLPSLVQDEQFASTLTEPIAKRLRTRGTGNAPAYFPTKRNSKKARVEISEDKSTSFPPEDSPVSDIVFTGSSARDAAHNHQPTLNADSATLKGILKRGIAVSSKQLAFIDEGVKERQALAESRRVEVEAVPACPTPVVIKGLLPDRIPNMQILSWNISGLRAFIEKHTWREINTLLPDVICLQETKVQSNDLFESLGVNVGATHAYWHHSLIKGHAGVAILSKVKPLQVIQGLPRSDGRTFAEKGHVITAEYADFFLVNAYVPNSSALLKNLQERLEWDKDFRAFLQNLQSKKPVIVAGDLNCALEEIDLSNPTRNQKCPGFTPQERTSLSSTIEQLKVIDVFRRLNPDTPGCYTFWSTRTHSRGKNIGWRLDYFLISDSLMPNVCGIQHFVDVMGSDHCPIMLYLETNV